MLSLDDVLMGARFFGKVPSFLRHPITLEEAHAILRQRLERRETDFLVLVKRAVYDNPRSPYRQLLRLAGCEFRDLERLVWQDGVEGALRALFHHGVYLTLDEFKGRRVVGRGRSALQVDPSQLRNPLAAGHLAGQTGGSRGRRTSVPRNLAFIRDGSVNDLLALAAHGYQALAPAIWKVPGGDAIWSLLRCAACGVPARRWFSQIDPAAAELSARYRWSARALRVGGALARVRFPAPEYVSLNRPGAIVDWMTGVLRAGGTPQLLTSVSGAVRVCGAALDAGIDLTGARFMMGGEPTTAARLAIVRRAGAEGQPRYASTETSVMALGCLAPDEPDDVHVFHDLHALIHAGTDVPGTRLPARALLVSSLRATAPLILLNVSLGDQAVIVTRRCECPLEGLGWTTHLHTIRSFEKLTAGGMQFLDADVVRVLEDVLPSRFGGAPTDYQLVEEGTDAGRPCLRLLVRPEVGPLDPDAVAHAFLAAIGTGFGPEKVMGLLWREAKLLEVERRAPLATASGKILHLHIGPGHAGP